MLKQSFVSVMFLLNSLLFSDASLYSCKVLVMSYMKDASLSPNFKKSGLKTSVSVEMLMCASTNFSVSKRSCHPIELQYAN